LSGWAGVKVNEFGDDYSIATEVGEESSTDDFRALDSGVQFTNERSAIEHQHALFYSDDLAHWPGGGGKVVLASLRQD
jgi:hypothetical protein